MSATVPSAMNAAINALDRTMAPDLLHGFHPIDVPDQRMAISTPASTRPP
jgi:hypothetical protein